MENASKALIIAGAILISILIIGLGVFIFNRAKSTVGKADLTSQEAEAQNQQFTAYFGDRVSSQEVKQLLSLIRSNNITGSTSGDTKTIAISGNVGTTYTASTDTSTISTKIVSGKTYTVKTANDNAVDTAKEKDFTTDTTAAYYKSGYIRIITINQN